MSKLNLFTICVFSLVLASACGSHALTNKTSQSPVETRFIASHQTPIASHNPSTQVPEASSTVTTSETVTFRGQQFDTYTVSYPNSRLAFYLNKPNGDKIGSLGSLKEMLASQGKELLFATNGGMYLKNQEPQGLYIEDGKEVRKIDLLEGDGNFHLKPNGVFYLMEDRAAVVETRHALSLQQNDTIRYATQSGPMLVIDGKLHPAFREGSTNLHYRNGVGILPDGRIVFVISQKTVNFYDFASLFKDHFGCKNALYLDGFVSRMYLPELGRQDSTGNFGVIIGVVR